MLPPEAPELCESAPLSWSSATKAHVVNRIAFRNDWVFVNGDGAGAFNE
jgi:hypothetical protein